MNKFFLLRQIHENEFKIDFLKKFICYQYTSKLLLKIQFYLETLTKCFNGYQYFNISVFHQEKILIN